MTGQETPRCEACGRQPDADTPTTTTGVPWTWSAAPDHRGRRTVLCPDCARENTRSIEARLDDVWW